MRLLTTLLLLSQAVAAAELDYDVILPPQEPTVTKDPRECNFLNLHTYFSNPTPTGDLEDVLISYGDELNKDCPWTDRGIGGLKTCPYPAQSVWCAFSDYAPASILPAWAGHVSEASSWWGEHSSEIVEYASMCPKRWFNAMISVPYGWIALNNTIHWASCVVEAHATDGNKVLQASPLESTSATTGMRTSENGRKETAGAKGTAGFEEATSSEGTARSTDSSSGVANQANGTGIWKIVGIGMAAMVVNWVL